jgi:hypothetical protein
MRIPRQSINPSILLYGFEARQGSPPFFGQGFWKLLQPTAVGERHKVHIVHGEPPAFDYGAMGGSDHGIVNETFLFHRG